MFKFLIYTILLLLFFALWVVILWIVFLKTMCISELLLNCNWWLVSPLKVVLGIKPRILNRLMRALQMSYNTSAFKTYTCSNFDEYLNLKNRGYKNPK